MRRCRFRQLRSASHSITLDKHATTRSNALCGGQLNTTSLIQWDRGRESLTEERRVEEHGDGDAPLRVRVQAAAQRLAQRRGALARGYEGLHAHFLQQLVEVDLV
eukprot:TRINITY_DN18254_c0_g1_i3.p2 TRINITY_DN18254_c0_g1~~TRINITY_DN18254_c0_g1_i3.p2  ORF type:complete len:105 (-),score=9.03 TRINITY_DN18254_c0_g1_i3:408-722(-)